MTGRSRCWTWAAGPACLHPRVREALPQVEVCGVDLVSDMLRKGKPRWRLDRGHVFPVRGDSERLPFESGSFDIVTCANSFHHYPRQDRAVAEMRRVLRPGGRLMIIDGYRDGPGVGSSTTSASPASRATFTMPRPGGFAS